MFTITFYLHSYVDLTPETPAERFKIICSLFLLSFISPKIVLAYNFCIIGYLYIINLNTIIIYTQVKFINS
jgi:hypothetical protein